MGHVKAHESSIDWLLSLRIGLHGVSIGEHESMNKTSLRKKTLNLCDRVKRLIQSSFNSMQRAIHYQRRKRIWTL